MPPPLDQTASLARRHALELPQVELRWKDAAGKHTRLLTGTALLGSAARADVVVEDGAVSKLHAELTVTSDGLWVRDLGSRNGTEVEGVVVREAKVPPKGTLVVGRTSIRVERARASDPEPAWHDDHFGSMIGGSDAMRMLYARVARAAASELSVLVQGETGTGKELVARALHDASPRARGPFVVVDCASLPENLVESELFGHVRGAFTGADRLKIGAAEEADGGTLFFDEVAELPLVVQPKLLRLLEQRELRRVGETKARSVDVRFVSATHKDLGAAVNAGLFREDLYFRLAAVTVRVPALREREGDLHALVAHFAGGRLEPSAAALLARELGARPLPGNVRELRHRVERYVALGELSTSGDAGRPSAAPAFALTAGEVPLDVPWKTLRDAHLEQLERAYVAGLLALHARNVTRVAEAAGLARSYVHKLIKRYDL